MRLREHIYQCEYIQPQTKLLVAVSGGPDSVVLLDVLYRTGCNCVVAHCNFHLRGEDSNEDARFVKQLALQYNMPFCTVDFDTIKETEQRGISVEMAARDLRYEWFKKMLELYQCDYVAVAHNADDNVETFFLNLLRGTGVQGLRGMAVMNNNILRPILGVSRAEIMAYIDEFQLQYRLDKTNSETIYTRNKIRHEILPLFKQVNPSFLNTMQNNIDNLGDVAEIFFSHLHDSYSECVQNINGITKIDIHKLEQTTGAKALLYQWLLKYNFSSEVARQLYKSLDAISGKQFISPTHYALINRGYIEIYPNSEVDRDEIFYINQEDDYIQKPIEISIEKISIDRLKIEPDRNIAYLDADKITYPLYLRRWKIGDSFTPFGMRGRKKLSDFFTNQKLSAYQKSQVWLLCSKNDIVWVVGYRIDNNYAVNKDTQRVVVFNNCVNK